MDKINNVAITTKNLFAALNIFARFSNKKSVYKNELGLKDSLMGKKEVFVSDKNDEKNIVGVRKSLEAVDASKPKPGFYEKYIKRIMAIVLSFGELVVLSPVYLLISLTIVIDNPDLTSLRMRFA